jgi:ketosteroid isomerase-like protein
MQPSNPGGRTPSGVRRSWEAASSRGSVDRGHEGVREFFRVQDETWDSITATPLAARDIGDRVMVEVQLNAKGRVSGAKVDRKTWNVFTIREGKIAAGRVFTSEVEASKAAGLSA